MLRVIFPALMILAMASCGGPPTEGRQRAEALEANPALAAAFLQGTTIKAFSRSDGGTQYHYLAPGGQAFMVAPGFDKPFRGRWIIQTFGSGGSLCMYHPTAPAKNLLVRGSFRDEWNCDVLSRQLQWFDEVYDGDVLGLATMTTLPQQLPARVDVPISVALKEIGRPPLKAPNKAVDFD